MQILNFVLIVVKMCSNELKIKEPLGHFDWNSSGSWYPILPNTQNMAISVENRHLRLKEMLKSKVLSQFNFKCHWGSFEFIGTHFDHNRYIIRICIFLFYL